MFYIVFFIAIEIAFSIVCVNKYWRYRVNGLGTPEGNWITKVGIVMAMVFLFQFVNMFLVILSAIGLVEAARMQLVNQHNQQAAALAAPASAASPPAQQAVTPATAVKTARRITPKGPVAASSTNPGMSRYKVKKP